MSHATAVNHVTIDERGIARIDDSRFKVIHLAAAVRSGIATPQELHAAYPQLTMAQICSALAHYYDHQSEMDAQIDREAAQAEADRLAAPESPGHRKLRERKLLP
jgi:uncharacterized protein (DUF433 family)